MNRIKITLSIENSFDYLMMVALCHYTLFDFFRVFIYKLPFVGFLSYLFFPLLYLVLVLLSYNSNRVKWIRSTDFLIVAFFVLSTAFSVLIYPQNGIFIAPRLFTSILPSIPFFFLGLCLTVTDDFWKRLSNCCCVAIVISNIYFFFIMSREIGNDEMSAAYTLLPNVLIVITASIFYKRWYYRLCGILGAIYIFLMGTRGPVVILCVYLIVCFWKRIKMKNSMKLFLSSVVLFVSFIFTQTSLYINSLAYLRKTIRAFGLSTRIIDFLIKDKLISDTSGRDSIFERLITKLAERPILGYGVYGEWQFVHWTAHNIYLETLFQYGVILGSIMILLYIYKVITSWRVSSNHIVRQWIILWSCLTFVRGFFGGSLYDYYVFFLLGFCLKEIRVAKCN